MTHRPNCLAPVACLAKRLDGHCRRCTITALNKDTSLTPKRVAGLKKAMALPENQKKRIAAICAGIARAKANGGGQGRRENGLRQAIYLRKPEVLARNQAPEVRAARGRAGSETKMAWCPPAYREMYFQLCRATSMKKAEAMPIILAQAAHDANEGARLVAHHSQRMLDNEARRRAQEY